MINARGQRIAQTYTEETGRYRLGLLPGSHTLVVSAADHPPRAQSVLVRPSQAELRVDIPL
ncbi:carboxypeptidase regulatory-like domain-containing protein [Streptomyces sp. MMS24-I2-30]|uniref:carboxypeptidase regulatory-like domain-containing protein n=1 Tax=Streptomyces sp. MMS24-I2-30 TaxID=3351564 RepID=UPI003896B3D2